MKRCCGTCQWGGRGRIFCADPNLDRSNVVPILPSMGARCASWVCAAKQPRPRRRAKPFGRWSVDRDKVGLTWVTFDGKIVADEAIVSALNSCRVVLKRGRS